MHDAQFTHAQEVDLLIYSGNSNHSMQLERCLKQKNTVYLLSYGRTLSDASMLYFADVFYRFFMAALVGQTAERIFTKLSHVVDISCYLRTY